MKWYSLFGIALVHISDQGSHFKNVVVSELNRRLSTKHHFTLPYIPWSNGTVEVVVREMRKLLKVWVSEFRIGLRKWPDLIPLMNHVLNFSILFFQIKNSSNHVQILILYLNMCSL
jgi:hypothetical protein